MLITMGPTAPTDPNNPNKANNLQLAPTALNNRSNLNTAILISTYNYYNFGN